MTEVKLKKGESVDKALRKLKKKMLKEDVLGESRKRKNYEKPSKKNYKEMRRKKYNQRNRSIEEAKYWG
jgi:small subunit ribosomal protein S21|tara:strand:+ start:234 stop:440 length:207 start_codon:yes stop_codon:yes gene_type:complete